MELAEATEITFKLRVTRIERQEIDRLIALANDFSKTTHDRALSLLENGDSTRAISGLAEAAKTQFCLYCLAIINCYAFLENNRNEILRKKFGENFGKNLKKGETLDTLLEEKGISHHKVRCYKTMDEFRLVNNAIKHSRLSGATNVTANNKRTYGQKQMIALYKKAERLDSYLADLFRIVKETGAIRHHEHQ